MDGTSFLPSAHSTVLVSEQTRQETENASMSVIAETSTLSDEAPADIATSKDVPNELPTASINKTCDMTAGIGVQCLPDSTVEETMETSALEYNRTMNMTTGVGCQTDFGFSIVDLIIFLRVLLMSQRTKAR